MPAGLLWQNTLRSLCWLGLKLVYLQFTVKCFSIDQMLLYYHPQALTKKLNGNLRANSEISKKQRHFWAPYYVDVATDRRKLARIDITGTVSIKKGLYNGLTVSVLVMDLPLMMPVLSKRGINLKRRRMDSAMAMDEGSHTSLIQKIPTERGESNCAAPWPAEESGDRPSWILLFLCVFT